MHIYIHTQAQTHKQCHTHEHVYGHMHTQIHTHTHTHTHMHTHTCTYTHTHTYMHMHIYIFETTAQNLCISAKPDLVFTCEVPQSKHLWQHHSFQWFKQ